MKKVLRIFLLAVLVSTGVAKSNEAKSQSANVSFSVFYNSLKPYGRWVNHSSYGQIWISNTKGFMPYSSSGHWAYTDYGWTWASDYNWGWAPFHYGRWGYEPSYGWFWVPGYQWAPAWVAWRNNNDYYGWAPLSPGVNLSVGISYSNRIPYDRWVFAPHRYITSPAVSRYYVPRSNNVTIIKNTTVVNNFNVKNNVHYVAGPRREDVEKVNNTKIHTYTITNSSKPGKTVVNNNTVNVYRPIINDNDKTVVNKNTTVNKNSNNTTVTKNSDNKNTTVKKNSDNKTVVNSNKKVNKETNKTTNETVKKKPEGNASQNKQVDKQKAKPQKEVAKKKNPNNNNNDDNPRKK